MALFDVHDFGSAETGPTLLILGGIHGNEPCGSAAIRQAKADIESGKIRLKRGLVRLIPDVNAAARDARVRGISRNLNRIIALDDPSDNEGRIAAELRPYLEHTNYLLDLHSYTVGGPPFALSGSDALSIAFARSTGPAAVITGWDFCYRRMFPDSTFGIGTTEYARENGAVAITYEAGQHDDPHAPDHAYDAILNALWHTDLLAGDRTGVNPEPPPAPQYRLSHIFMKEGEGDFAQEWKHLQPVQKGEVFATYNDGQKLIFPESGVVILPHRNTPIGTEWGYLGLQVD
jgi:predicted deacylase